MQVARVFDTYDPTIHARPWLARVDCWPDAGPPRLAFGRLVKSTNICQIEAAVGDVMRWQMKAHSGAIVINGWGIVSPLGSISGCSEDDARAARRRLHPEDAKATPIAVPGTGKAKPRAFTPLTPEQLAERLLKAVGMPAPDATSIATLLKHAENLTYLSGATLPAPAAPATSAAVAAPTPEPEPYEAPNVPTVTGVDESGYPLF